MSFHPVIGIDLGTTYSAVAAWDSDLEQAVIIPDRLETPGSPTPSVVSLDRSTNRVIVGVAAKRNLPYDPANTVLEIKREMGEVFREDTLDKYRARGVYRPFEPVEGGYEGDPVMVPFCNERFRPQEISAFILRKMKGVAEAHLGQEVRDAVITVPAYFTAKQRKATEDAALLAGLYPRQLIPEPTAAAICYGADQHASERRIYLVYDLGGGTFDVSIIAAELNNVDVVATSGDPRLGGADFDEAITKWATSQLPPELRSLVEGDERLKAIIRGHAEAAKIELSTYPETKIILPELRPEAPPVLDLSREVFVSLIDDLLGKSLSYVDNAIQRAEKKGTTRDQVDAILLVGGSVRIPRVKERLLEYFERDEDFVQSDLDPDAVVARGAGRVAMKFHPTPHEFDVTNLPDQTLVDLDAEEELGTHQLITEHSLGVGVQDNRVVRIVEASTHIPVSVRRGGFANPGPVSDLEARVFQGEGEFTWENDLLGIVHLGPMEPKSEGFHKFEISFALDVNGTLAVTVHHLNEGKDYTERFEEKTAVAASDLSRMYEKIKAMYGEVEPVAEAEIPPPPPPVPPGPAAAGEPVPAPPAPPEPAQPQPTGAEPVPAPPAPPQPPQPEAAEAAPATTPEAPGETRAGDHQDLLEPTAEVPADFNRIVRRAKKHLLRNPDPELAHAFNRFITALNAGEEREELEDLGDDLEDAYFDSRSRSG